MENWKNEKEVPWNVIFEKAVVLILNEGITSIGNYAFDGFSEIKNIEIPNSIISIGDYSFYECSGLESVKFGESLKTFGKYSFGKCSSLKSISLPETVETINEGSFHSCSSLSEIVLPKSVKEIGNKVFYRNEKLRKVEYEGINEIECGEEVFVMTRIKKVDVKEGYIGNEFCGKKVEKS